MLWPSCVIVMPICVPSTYCRPGSAGLDYEDNIDDVYIPPMRKQETSTKLKHKSASSTNSSGNGLVQSLWTKKRRLNKVSNGGVAVATACSTCIHVDSPNRLALIPKTQEAVDNSDRNEQFSNKNCSLMQSHSNCTPNAVDTRDLCGEDCAKAPTINSTSDITINGANVRGSES